MKKSKLKKQIRKLETRLQVALDGRKSMTETARSLLKEIGEVQYVQRADADRLIEFIKAGRKLVKICREQHHGVDGVLFNGHEFDILWRLIVDDHGELLHEPLIDGEPAQ